MASPDISSRCSAGGQKTSPGPCPRRRRPAAGRRPDPCRARWRHSSPRPPPPQRAEGLRLGLQQFHLHGQLSDPLHGAIQFRLHRIALALLERGVDPAASLSHATARAGRSLRPTGATEVAPARHAKAAERPHACAPPSIAGQVPAGLPAKPGLGKTWTSQARPHLPQAHQQQLSSQNYRSCSGPPWTLRLSQFCVQGNRVRLIHFCLYSVLCIFGDTICRNNFLSGLKVRDEGARTC